MADITEIFKIKCDKYGDEQLNDDLMAMLAIEAVQEYAMMTNCSPRKGGVTA